VPATQAATLPPIDAGSLSRRPLQLAILKAVAYGDIFDQPLTAEEIHRYLVGTVASPAVVGTALESLVPDRLSRRDGHFTLVGREELLDTRRAREGAAARLWPDALAYGRLIARLPFVRMVAVSGALAMDNTEPGADIDYLIVTEPGRLWLCRAMVIAIVRLAALRSIELCPNFLVSERALLLDDQSLFTAHELAQMVPLAGLPTYWRMRGANRWADELLPNATGAPQEAGIVGQAHGGLTKWVERMLRTEVGVRLERWERERKIRKLSRVDSDHGETAFTLDWCKGHFDGHRERVLSSFRQRMLSIDAEVAW
jgi:hypothetical protein